MEEKLKTWWTISELAKADWFPLDNKYQIIQHIRAGTLKTIRVGALNENYRRYKIHKDDALSFITNQYNN